MPRKSDAAIDVAARSTPRCSFLGGRGSNRFLQGPDRSREMVSRALNFLCEYVLASGYNIKFSIGA